MDPRNEKDVEASSEGSTPKNIQLYDPSQESIWTRLGVNFESFKRAPGVTGYVVCLLLSIVYSDCVFWSDRLVVGDLTEAEIEKIKSDTPMLQAKMKKRHLTMIAVGA